MWYDVGGIGWFLQELGGEAKSRSFLQPMSPYFWNELSKGMGGWGGMGNHLGSFLLTLGETTLPLLLSEPLRVVPYHMHHLLLDLVSASTPPV